ncbi:MAG: serine hydrolase domain-containing protein [Pseudobdellovibrionaceae bacterium]
MSTISTLCKLCLTCFGLVTISSGAISAPLSQATSSTIKTKLEEILQAQLKRTDTPIINATLSIKSPSKNFSFDGAVGLADGVQEKMTPEHRYRIASESKTVTAVLILQLMEEGRLNLDQHLSDFFTDSELPVNELHKANGVPVGNSITLRQLLNHSSGLADYVFDNPNFISDVRNNPTKQWSPHLIFGTYFAAHLETKPYFSPGEGYHYSDTNYALLAMVIEKVYKRPLASVIREKVLKPLKMSDTYLEWYENPVTRHPMSHPFSETIDNSSINTSFDWGGGGLVSTNKDLNKFLRGLFGMKLFKKKSTLATMIDWENSASKEKKFYAYGISHIQLGRFDLIGHTGVYGAVMVIDPKQDLTIIFTVNQVVHNNEFELLKQIAETLDTYWE